MGHKLIILYYFTSLFCPTNKSTLILIEFPSYLLADYKNGTLVPATIPDGGGHRQFECTGASSEADQCGADRSAGKYNRHLVLSLL